MATIRQILVDWTTISGSGKVSVFYFTSAVAVATQRAALGTFLGATDAHLDNSCSWTIRTTGVDVDDASGALVDSWADATAQTGTGAGGTEPVADATQILVRWKTPTILGGRFVQGRTYIPGCASSNEVNGNVVTATSSAIAGFANTLIGSGAGLLVWHRPISGSGGLGCVPETATVWSEFAVLRRRRG